MNFGKPELNALVAIYSCCDAHYAAPLDAVLNVFRRPDEGRRTLLMLQSCGFCLLDEPSGTVTILRDRVRDMLGLSPHAMNSGQPGLFRPDIVRAARARVEAAR